MTKRSLRHTVTSVNSEPRVRSYGVRYWHEDCRLGWRTSSNGAREGAARAWSEGRFAISSGDRASVAKRLGLSLRTLERFEIEGTAHRWYPLALLGLAYVDAHGTDALPPAFQAIIDVDKVNRRQTDNLTAAS